MRLTSIVDGDHSVTFIDGRKYKNAAALKHTSLSSLMTAADCPVAASFGAAANVASHGSHVHGAYAPDEQPACMHDFICVPMHATHGHAALPAFMHYGEQDVSHKPPMHQVTLITHSSKTVHLSLQMLQSIIC